MLVLFFYTEHKLRLLHLFNIFCLIYALPYRLLSSSEFQSIGNSMKKHNMLIDAGWTGKFANKLQTTCHLQYWSLRLHILQDKQII